MYIYIYIHIHVCIYIYIYTHIICVYIYIYIHTHTYVCNTYIYIYIIHPTTQSPNPPGHLAASRLWLRAARAVQSSAGFQTGPGQTGCTSIHIYIYICI